MPKYPPEFYNYHSGSSDPLITPRHLGTTINPTLYRALAIKHALKLYAHTGIKVNRAYTPRAMMRAVEEITGKKFRVRDYLIAVKELEVWIEQNKYRLDAEMNTESAARG